MKKWDLWGVMDKFRIAMGLLVGTILGVVWGISFKSVAVGFTTAACFSAHFIYIFNKFKRSRK